VEQPGGETVAQDADTGKQDDHFTENGLRVIKSLHCPVNNEGRRTYENGHVHGGGQDLSPFVTECVLKGSSFPSDAMCNIGKQDGHEVAEIVGSIGNEGHAVGINTSDDLGHGDNEVECQCN